MCEFIVNGKTLPIPSFFQVYNYGGGFGDKSREVVYADMTTDTPALLNYFYISNKYPHMFQAKDFDNIGTFSTIGDVFNNIRKNLIEEKGYLYSGYPETDYDFNSKIILLDSGASNIVKFIAKDVDYNVEAFKEKLLEDMISYYDFADRYKFDIVIGFDLGGKYTFKDDEKNNVELNQFYDYIDKDEINRILLEKTTDYMISHPNYYPKVMATIHGRTPEEYKRYAIDAINLERITGYHYWGFALGGVASSKGIDNSWKEGIVMGASIKKNAKNALIPARAAKIVHNIVGNRPIHALGCGGYPNIAMNYFCGATSFDAASPARRVGDGNELSTNYVFDQNPPKKVRGKDVSFSKMFVGGLKSDLTLFDKEFDYIRINELDNNEPLCGCMACDKVNSFRDIKTLYANKSVEEESFYYAKQLMNIHAILQHRRLCEKLVQYDSMEDFCNDNPTSLNLQLLEVFNQL